MHENEFVVTAENLLDVNIRYESFLEADRKRISHFQESFINPFISAMKELIDIFESDLNKVVFGGLSKAMAQIDVVYGPMKDALDYFVGRVVRNTKHISLHLNNLMMHGHKYEELEKTISKTVEYASVAEKSLPKYYSMVTDVSKTMKELGFEFDDLIFPPQRLAHSSENCSREVDKFVNSSHLAGKDLRLILDEIRS